MMLLAGMARSARRRITMAVVPLTLGACAFASPAFEAPPVSAIPQLQAAFEADVSDVAVALSLAASSIAASNVGQARDVLRVTHEAVPSDRTVVGVLAMTEHELGEYLAAFDHYSDFLDAAPFDPMAALIQARQDIIRPMALRARASRMWALDSTPSVYEASRDRVAVLPVGFSADVAAGASLTVALTDLLAVDLRSVDQTVIDPSEARALAEAADVPSGDRLSLRAVARLGGALGAGTIVAPYLSVGPASELTLTATIVQTEGTVLTVDLVSSAGTDPLVLEKRLAVLVVESLSGRVGPLDAGAVARREVSVLESAIAFGEGLAHSDAGRLVEAATAFRRAAALDPDFERAQRMVQRAELAIEIEGSPLAESVVEAARVGELQRGVAAIVGRRDAFGRTGSPRVGATTRGGVAELFGIDLLSGDALFVFSLALPGGTP